MWAVISTWEMSFNAVKKYYKGLKESLSSREVLENIIREIEDYPLYKSVGYGGLPNQKGEVELDAAFMNGKILKFGAVAALKDIKNPISVAIALSENYYNSFLVGEGAREWALENNFESKNMLTFNAKNLYEERKRQTLDKNLSPYSGHDTVGTIVIDKREDIVVGTSTSGLFMKKSGRVGDSPLVGSGFYAENGIGAATATGLGEDIAKGVLSYEIVRLIERGESPMLASKIAVKNLIKKLSERGAKIGDISVIAMRADCEWGVFTNIKDFSFTLVSKEEPIRLMRASYDGIDIKITS